MAHGVKLEVAEGNALHLTIGGMIDDAVLVAAEAIACLQHRRMLIGDARQLVEPTAGELTQPREVRLEMRMRIGREIQLHQVSEASIQRMEIRPSALCGHRTGRARHALTCWREARWQGLVVHGWPRLCGVSFGSRGL